MIDLGKYSATVITAYGVSILLLLALVWQTIKANARARRALEKHKKHG